MQLAMTLRPMSLGDLLDASFSLYRRQLVPLVFVALATQAIPLALSLYVEAGGGMLEHPFAWFVAMLASIVLGQLGIATSTFMVAEAYLGGSITPSDAFQRAQPFVGRLIASAFASGLLYVIGFLLLIVPGIIVLCGLAVTAPAIVLENQVSGTAGMRRSFHLTRGHRGKIFLAYLVAFLLIMLPGIALGAFTVAAAGNTSVGTMGVMAFLVISVLQVLAYPFLYVLATLLYYDLRVRKEAYDLEMLSASLGTT
ncbi:MAG: hypothetical protein IT361_04550 [Gemmatimonadaceae bacterium]|nr:hypothetical protein [Gemmatimonadaceae bacterium]